MIGAMRLSVVIVLALVAMSHAQTPSRTPEPSFSVVEASIADLQAAMEQGRTTSREIVRQYLERIAVYENRLNAAITVNPRALADADDRDRERRDGRVRGPLHGIPIALKDNIHTTDMPTTGGALAFESLLPPYEATLTNNLREAGAIVIAKTVLTELANWVAEGMPTNYSSLASFGFNPYDPRRDPRDINRDGRPVLAPGGSSSGIGTAASFWAANVGTETSGSILNPASQTMLVGIKPTLGRISRHGVIPIAGEQDTPGPMAKSVADAALLLGVLESASPDPNDAATRTCTPPPGRDYTPHLRPGALAGARIGIPRAFYYDASPSVAGTPGGLTAPRRTAMNEAITILTSAGAVVVDPANIPSVLTRDASGSFLRWPICSGASGARGRDDNCSIVFKYGMKRDFNAWLASLGAAAPVKTLTELRAWNRAHERAGALKYGQVQLDNADEMDLERDRARYLADREKDLQLAGRDGIDAALDAHKLDALLFPGPAGAAIAARPGYPSVTVPFAMVPNDAGVSFPPGFTPKPAPFGVTFTGGRCSEPRLIELAYAFEQRTRRRIAPPLD
jgi:amidase